MERPETESSESERLAARVAALESSLALQASTLASLEQWRRDVEERRRQARAARAAAVATTEADGGDALKGTDRDEMDDREAEKKETETSASASGKLKEEAGSAAAGARGSGGSASGAGRVRALGRLWGPMWKRAQGLVLRGAINFLVFLYMSKLHQWLMSVWYKYYVLLLLRLS